MEHSYELAKLSPHSFEHLVNALAIRVLGNGVQTFGPGPDGGRDGLFEGEAPYPSLTDRWSGKWYIQSKFHSPNLSSNQYQWLIDQVKSEIEAFEKEDSKRRWPDNWIIATNIDPSGIPETGAHDTIKGLIKISRPGLENRTKIWGGKTILDLLDRNKDLASTYGHFLTPGHILTQLYNNLTESRAQISDLLSFLVVKSIGQQQFMKLDQAGDKSDIRPAVHSLFVDLPCEAKSHEYTGNALATVVQASAQVHKPKAHKGTENSSAWKEWECHPSRSKTWLIKGGPGQGKSTIGQYLCQINRSALIQDCGFPISVTPKVIELATEIKKCAEQSGFWTAVPRIPLYIELKEYAYWFKQQAENQSKGVLTYLSQYLKKHIEQEIFVGTLRAALREHLWLIIFDGLDEVPQDTKETVAYEVIDFVTRTATELQCDLLSICTSRPQGYSGQFDALGGVVINLTPLTSEQGLECALPVIKMGRNAEEVQKAEETLKSSITTSKSVQELMTSPLQCHIMAVVVRDGGGLPERKWRLYNNFYNVIKQREINKAIRDATLTRLLRDDDQLIKSVHCRLGFILHALAESSEGAPTSLSKDKFRELVSNVVFDRVLLGRQEIVDTVMTAATERLILINTPDDGDHFRFDIRPLQEFFASEFLYDGVETDILRDRVEKICGDSHWSEVMHFLLSALIECGRLTEFATACKILERLDGAIDDCDRRVRAAIGSGVHIAATLLSEGVLDQDRRIRSMMNPSFREIRSTVDREILRTISQGSRKNSCEFRNRLVTDNFTSESEANRLGSAVIIALCIEENSDVIQIKNTIAGSSTGFLEAFFQQLSRLLRNKFLKPNRWPIEIGFDILLNCPVNPGNLSLINSVVSYIEICHESALDTARELSWSPARTAVLQMILDDSWGLSDETEEDFGIISIIRPQFPVNEQLGNFAKIANDFQDNDLPIAGYFRYVWLIHEFASTGNERILSEIQSFLSEIKDCSKGPLIPYSLRSQLPCAPNKLCNLIDDKEGIQTVIFKGEKPSPDQWDRLVAGYPSQALNILTLVGFDNGEDTMNFLDENAGAVIANRVIEEPGLVGRLPGVWGALIQLNKGMEPQLRNAFRKSVTEFGGCPNESRPCVPMSVRLPDEEILFPHVVYAAFNGCFSTYRRRNPVSISKWLIDAMKTILPDPAICERYMSEDLSMELKLALCWMRLWHPDINCGWNAIAKDLLTIYRGSAPNWFLHSLTLSLCMRSSKTDEAVIGFLNELLGLGVSDFLLRIELQRLFSIWRETSIFPVQTSKNLPIWPPLP